MAFVRPLSASRWPRVRGITIMSNSTFNGRRFEDAWLDN
jgi:hypothetical protein